MFYKANVTGDVSHARWVRYREGYVLDQAMVSLVATLWQVQTVGCPNCILGHREIIFCVSSIAYASLST